MVKKKKQNQSRWQNDGKKKPCAASVCVCETSLRIFHSNVVNNNEKWYTLFRAGDYIIPQMNIMIVVEQPQWLLWKMKENQPYTVDTNKNSKSDPFKPNSFWLAASMQIWNSIVCRAQCWDGGSVGLPKRQHFQNIQLTFVKTFWFSLVLWFEASSFFIDDWLVWCGENPWTMEFQFAQQ